MGQRHQIFLKINNPVKNDRLFTKKGERTKAIKAFGNGKYTILALHHQWLYGRSAAVNILNMLLYTNQDTMSHYGSPLDKDFMDFNDGYNESTLDGFQKVLTQFLGVQCNVLHPRGIGNERMHLLNTEDSHIRMDFTRGDNNDGITIIDTLTGKYCMMNIYSYPGDDEINNDASNLPEMQPVSAREYMKAYYPETVSTLSDYQRDGKNLIERVELVTEHKRDNIIIDEEIDDKSQGVLTLPELKKMFPKFYRERRLEKV